MTLGDFFANPVIFIDPENDCDVVGVMKMEHQELRIFL